jgi:hypothetical protein
LKNSLAKLALVAIILSSCSSLRREFPPPDVYLGTAVWKGTVEESYGYFTPYFYEGQKPFRLPAEAVFKQKTFLIRATDFELIQKYIEDLEREASRRCR